MAIDSADDESYDEHDADSHLEPLQLEAIIPTDNVSLSRSRAWSLYLSHALSTWNARAFEFAAILFTASAFPNTLLASSVRGICNTLASVCLSSWIGGWIDRAPSRLKALLMTISVNRAAVILSCFGWAALVDRTSVPSNGNFDSDPTLADKPSAGIYLLFALIIVLGICEKLSAMGNMLSMERDWVPVLASHSDDTVSSYDLTKLNAVMRRIDLMCKLIAPLVISAIISRTSTKVGVAAVAGMSLASWGIEAASAHRVWISNPNLRKHKIKDSVVGDNPVYIEPQRKLESTIKDRMSSTIRKQAKQVRWYFSTDVWLPSLSLALLYVSVLTYSATFITYLLNSDFSLIMITIARALSSLVEVSSTFLTPLGVEFFAKLRPPPASYDRERLLEPLAKEQSRLHSIGLERLGVWSIWSQTLNLIPVVLAVWQIGLPQSRDPGTSNIMSRIAAFVSPLANQPLATISLFLFLSISRLGLWTFDLTVQEITQTRVPEGTQSSFGGTEMAFVSVFELSQWIAAAVFARPEEFRWLALGSLCAVACAASMYSFWVRRQRGHLMHFDRIKKQCSCVSGRD